MNIFAVDCGFSQVKWTTGVTSNLFPSALSKLEDSESSASNNFNDGLKAYVGDKGAFYVGTEALRPLRTQEYCRDMDWIVDHSPYFVARAADAAKVDLSTVDCLAMGLPIENFDAHRKRLIEVMSNFQINGSFYTPEIRVYPQGFGAMKAFLAEHAGKVRPEDNGLIVDVGSKTVLVLNHFGYTVQRKGSNQYPLGLSVAADKMTPRLLEVTGGQNLTLIKAQVYAKAGEVVNADGEFEDIREIVKEGYDDHFGNLVKQITTHYSDLAGMRHIILAGGGAPMLKNKLPPVWAKKSIVLENSEYANVRGYLRAARGE